MMLTKNMVPFLLLGFLLTAYLNVTVVGVALFGIVAVMLVMSVSKNKTQQEDFVDDNEF